MRRNLLALAIAVGVGSAGVLAHAGVVVDAGDITVTSGGVPLTFSYPISVILDGTTPATIVRSVDLKLSFASLPDNTLRTVPAGAPVSFAAPDFGGTVNPSQGTFLHSGSGFASNGFGQAISAGGATGTTAPANSSTTILNFNFQIPANTPGGTYFLNIIPNDSGVLSLGTAEGELNWDAGDFSLTSGFIHVVTVPVPSGAHWNVDADGLFPVNSNWLPSAPSGPSGTAVFGLKITQNRTVTVNSAISIGAVAFDNPFASYTLSGSGSLTVNNGAGGAPLSVSSGNHTISVPVTATADSAVAIAPFSSLTVARFDAGNHAVSLSGGGKLATSFLTASTLSVASNSLLDLGRGKAVLTGMSESAVRSLVSSFLSTGHGLGSTASGDPRDPYATLAVFDNTAAPAVPYYSTFNATPVSAGSILVMYTYKGDTNLDGVVDGKDLADLLEGYSNGGSGWHAGDFDYNGIVDSNDISAYFLSLANQGAPFTGGGSGDPQSGGSVPEPTTTLGILPPLVLLFRRQRGRSL